MSIDPLINSSIDTLICSAEEPSPLEDKTKSTALSIINIPIKAYQIDAVGVLPHIQNPFSVSKPMSFCDKPPIQPNTNALAEETQKLFKEGELLVRGMTDELYEDAPQLKFSSWNRELSGLHQADKDPEQMLNVSTTLLHKGYGVSTYTNNGMLFNSNLGKVLVIADHDINTAIDEDGSLINNDNQSCLSSLEELRTRITSNSPNTSQQMNEIRIKLPLTALKALFILKHQNSMQIAQAKLKILCVQKQIEKKYNIILPIFIYDNKEGLLTPYSNSKEDIPLLLSQQNQPHMSKAIKEHLN